MQLKAGNGEDIFTRNGRWNFNNKVSTSGLYFLFVCMQTSIVSTHNIWNSVSQRLIRASSIDKWAVVNFSARCNVRDLVRDLIKCGGMKGIVSLFSQFLAHFPKCILIDMFGIAECRTTFQCIWRESFYEAGTSCKKGWGHVWTSENKASWST